ncbi:hypothetical protein H5410_002088 [Solanum commersonii]|uniref:Uncharacterized protein n=1 Tax=Solanum commersonii TaxID=4109 RepID=A0A9J6B1D5_SOLCO|nr:hypothetical protein H5410_002088 [Solanum commersonii]
MKTRKEGHKYLKTRIESTSTFGDVSTGVSLLLSTSSIVYSALMHRISVEKDKVISKSLAASRATPIRRHNSVINTGKGKEVCLFLALMAISYSMIRPKFSCLFDKIYPKQAAFCHCNNSATLEYLPSRPSVESSFSSKMVRKPSPFNQLRSLGGGTTGGTGSIGGARVGTDSTGVDAGGTLVDVG